MPIINRIADLHDEITEWRRDLHENPELQFDVHRTAGIVADKLRAFGVDEVVEGIGITGVVGVIKGRGAGPGGGSGKVIGMRADMDALPINEATGLAHASKTPGKMHACGHDGHTSMLLGAAKYLSETRNFDGTAVVIFQPAEEGGGGGEKMVQDGMMERFGIQQVYGMHNAPGLPVGQFGLRPGPLMASTDEFTIDLEGKGGHAAKPHDCIDTTLVAAQLLQALQSVVSRNVDPVESAVLSITSLHTGGDAFNVIPQTVHMKGTIRTLKEEVRGIVEKRLRAMIDGLATAFDAKITMDFRRGYPVTVNHEAEAMFAADVAEAIAGNGNVERDHPPVLGAEDFSYMLNERPGAMIWIGNGDTAMVHHPEYDFNDAVIPYGVSYWAKLAETAMPAG
jgi:hippurate hydrolase